MHSMTMNKMKIESAALQTYFDLDLCIKAFDACYITVYKMS